MEEKIIAAYIRDYSELPGLQKAARIEYRLLRVEGNFCLSLQSRPGGRSAVCSLPGLAGELASGLLRFVYENGICPEQLADVVQDALYELCDFSSRPR